MKKEPPLKRRISLDIVPVGVRVLGDSLDGYKDCARYRGISYCNAVHLAGLGMELLVTPGSVTACQWVPVALGFKQRENSFERSIKEGLEPFTAGVYLSPLHLFKKETEPQVVIIRTSPDKFRELIRLAGPGAFMDPHGYARELTALDMLLADSTGPSGPWLIRNFNRGLDLLNRYPLWQRFTTTLFRSTALTNIFNRFISRYMANMSVCRNSTVMPLLTGRANISYFCTGGIAWGKNSAFNMTSGFPWEIFRKIENGLDYPGKHNNDPRLGALERERERFIKSQGL